MRQRLKKIVITTVLYAALGVGCLQADELEFIIHGVEEPMLGNVRSMVEPFRLVGTARLSRRRLEMLRAESEQDARQALRPYGFYHPVIQSRTEKTGERAWRLVIDIQPGDPVIVATLQLDISGPGAGLADLREWQSRWPLRPGTRLEQPEWDRLLQEALDISASHGYLLAAFTQRSMEVDLERKEAALKLVLETGQQAAMGEVRFHQDFVNPHVLDQLPRFLPGDPYDAWMIERFRIDIWRTGYFGNIDVIEDRQLESSPPIVDLDVTVDARKPNTYQGTIGIGSDTGLRAKFSWNRHLASNRGDSFSLATGLQDHNNEFYVRGAYRIPRKVNSRQFWIADAMLKRENEDLKVRSDDPGEDLFVLGNADIDDYSFRVGRLKVYDRKQGYRQWFQTVYAQYLFEEVAYRVRPGDPPAVVSLLEGGGTTAPLEQSSHNLALGIEVEMPFVQGQGFNTNGMIHRAWAFHSSEAWGSEDEFTQVYFSTRWNLKAGSRWKILLRGEVGYSDAQVNDMEIRTGDQSIRLSVTDLPNLYRFKAGGSTSVRGYGFEQLSNNNIGSNNVLTASAEAEMKLFDNWSAAAFFDIGNAFNHWGEIDLKKGVGLGIRWYTIAGAVRVDVARGLDQQGDPWHIHFTIGTSLL